MTAPLSLRERRHAQTRDDLVAATLAVIADEGLDAATIDQIAGRAGVSRGTVYAHLSGGRDELLRLAYAELGHRLVDRTRAALDAASGWDDALTGLAGELFALASDRHLGHFYNVTGPALMTDRERGIGSGASIIMIREVLSAAQAKGSVDAEVDPAATAALLVGALREAGIAVAAGSLTAAGALAAFSRLAAGLDAR